MCTKNFIKILNFIPDLDRYIFLIHFDYFDIPTYIFGGLFQGRQYFYSIYLKKNVAELQF